jgi:Peptidyl-tRNA hydrolase PTH2
VCVCVCVCVCVYFLLSSPLLSSPLLSSPGLLSDAIIRTAQEAGVPHTVICDAGKTQIAPNTDTAIAVGPAPEELVNKITGQLRRL